MIGGQATLAMPKSGGGANMALSTNRAARHMPLERVVSRSGAGGGFQPQRDNPLDISVLDALRREMIAKAIPLMSLEEINEGLADMRGVD